MNHTFIFNGDTISVAFNFHGSNCHIEVESKTLGTIENSSAPAADYAKMETQENLEKYGMTALALHAYQLHEDTTCQNQQFTTR